MRSIFVTSFLLFILVSSGLWTPLNAQALQVERADVPLVRPDLHEPYETFEYDRQKFEASLHAIIGGGITYLKAVSMESFPRDSDGRFIGSMIRNEAHLSELKDPSTFRDADTFVPAQMGQWLTTLVLAHAYSLENPEFEAGITDQEFLELLTANITALEYILENHAYTHHTGKKAFFQRHNVPTGIPSYGDSFDQIISFLDNTYLVAGLEVVSAYLEREQVDAELTTRVHSVLAQFDLSMWVDEDGEMYQELHPKEPFLRQQVDRILTEARLSPVVAFARDEISAATLSETVAKWLSQSKSGSSLSGRRIEYMPYSGRALEVGVATAYLSNELRGRFARETLIPLSIAQKEVANSLGLPAPGATPVGNGFYHFVEFGLSPCEACPTVGSCGKEYTNSQVIIPSATATTAGTIGSLGTLNDLVAVYESALEQGQFDPIFGFPNGYINTNQQLQFEAEAYTSITNEWGRDWHVRASSKALVHLSRPNDQIEYDFEVSQAGEYYLSVRYSNAHSDLKDQIEFWIDGDFKNVLQTQGTGLPRQHFINSPIVYLGELAQGTHNLRLVLSATDSLGVDLDVISIGMDQRLKPFVMNLADPLWGTLEVEQLTVPLLNYLLGGSFIETLLSRDPQWAKAYDYYAEAIHQGDVDSTFDGDLNQE